jgi:hypothetical protein
MPAAQRWRRLTTSGKEGAFINPTLGIVITAENKNFTGTKKTPRKEHFF